MERLPREVIRLILFGLSSRDILLSCAQVSKQWKQWTRDEELWKALCERENFGDSLQYSSWKVQYAELSQMKVLVLYCNSPYPAYPVSVQSQIVNSGLLKLSQVDIVYTAEDITPEFLSKYRAVLLFHDYGFRMESDLLYNYLKNGKGVGVVLCTFANCKDLFVFGQWHTENLYPILLGDDLQTYGSLEPVIQNHPILKGVDLGTLKAFSSDGQLHPDATLIANWSHGRHLAAKMNTHRIVGLNIYPVRAWIRRAKALPVTETDIQVEIVENENEVDKGLGRLMANALRYVCSENYFT